MRTGNPIRGNPRRSGLPLGADALGAFKLEADVKGLVITPPNVRPFFTGQVLPAVTVPVTVFIVRDSYSNNPARASSEIPGLLDDANKILKQRGITLEQLGDTHFLNSSNWLDHTDALAQTNDVIDGMMDSTNSMGSAVELYFVRSLDGGDLLGACRPKGIAIANGGDAVTVAHEVLHSCGTEDIYTVELNDPNCSDPHPVTGPVIQERLPADWGGGYYPPSLTQREAVARLIMRSGGINEDNAISRFDLPSGSVFGWKHSVPSDGTSPKTLGLSGVGQSSCQTLNGSY